MNFNPYEILLMVLTGLLLGQWRNSLFKRATATEPFPQLAKLTLREQAVTYLFLVVGTLLLMFWFAPLTLPATLIAMIVTLIFSFLILLMLNEVLITMRQHKQLPILFIINPQVLLVVGFIIAVELSFLNWVKEVAIYFQKPFFNFTILYAVCLFIAAMKLSLKVNEYESAVKKNRHFIMLIILDSIIVVLLSGIMLYITVAIMYFGYSF